MYDNHSNEGKQQMEKKHLSKYSQNKKKNSDQDCAMILCYVHSLSEDQEEINRNKRKSKRY